MYHLSAFSLRIIWNCFHLGVVVLGVSQTTHTYMSNWDIASNEERILWFWYPVIIFMSGWWLIKYTLVMFTFVVGKDIIECSHSRCCIVIILLATFTWLMLWIWYGWFHSSPLNRYNDIIIHSCKETAMNT